MKVLSRKRSLSSPWDREASRLAARRRAHAAGAHGFLHSRADSLELVVAGGDLVQGVRVRGFLKDAEVLQQSKEPLRREHAMDQIFQIFQLQGCGCD